MKICERILFCILLFAVTASITSCEKAPGKELAGSITGTGTIAVGPANTFIYQIKGSSVITCKPATYQLSFLQGTDPYTKAPITLVSAYNPTTQDLFSFGFTGLTTGSYDLEGGYSFGTTTKGNTKGSAKVNVTMYNTTGNGLQVKGTLQGTFDGYFADQSGDNPVRVSGSFNITQ